MYENNSRHSKSVFCGPIKGLFLTIALAATFSAFAEQTPPLNLSATIPLPEVKGGFDLMAIDLAGKRLFVNAEDNNTMEVIDVSANKHIRSVRGLSVPKWVVYRPESHRLYIANGGDGSVRILDSISFAPIKTLNFKEKANNLRFDDKTKELFVGVGKTFGSIGIIDTKNDSIISEIKLANFPKQFELEKNGNRIFANIPEANHVAVIDRAKGRVIETWPVKEAKDNVPMGFDETHHRLFIGCEPGKLVVMDSVNGKSVASVDISEECDSIYYDAKRKLVYISCGAGFLDVIQQSDADHYKHAGKVPTAPGAATSLFVPGLSQIFVAVPQKENQQAAIRVYTVK